MATKTENYLNSKSVEINAAQSSVWVRRLLAAFPAFRHRNFQLYFSGQLISLIGTWLQTVTQGWLVLELTGSAFWVGLVAALGSLPVLLFGLFGGVIVDRLPKKNILYFTQISAGVLAAILGILASAKIVNVYEISALAFLLGTVTAVDSPARQAFVVEMVGKEDLHSAIAINSGTFNAARVIGPAFAGALIVLVGTGGTFLLNAMSYIAVVLALFFIKVKPVIAKVHPHPFEAIREGLKYSFSHLTIGNLLIFTAATSIFGWSYSTIMPVIVKNVFHQGAGVLGYMYAISGVGAVCGAVIVSAFAKKFEKLTFVSWGNFIFAVSLILFSLTSNLYLGYFFLFFVGLGLLMQFSMINTMIQHLVSDHLRGRVMSIYTLMFLGTLPFGNFEIGFISEHFGTGVALRSGAILLLIFGFIIFRTRLKPKDHSS